MRSSLEFEAQRARCASGEKKEHKQRLLCRLTTLPLNRKSNFKGIFRAQSRNKQNPNAQSGTSCADSVSNMCIAQYCNRGSRLASFSLSGTDP